MSERIYGWLIRLFPSRFREKYGEEALKLVRDRRHAEKGIVAGIRLWMDLLFDLLISAPREHLRAQSSPVSTVILSTSVAGPTFFVLEHASPKPASFFFGCLTSLVALTTFWILLGHGGRYVALPALASEQSWDEPRPDETQAVAGQPRNTVSSAKRGTAKAFQVDAEEQERVIDAASAILKKYYVERDTAQKMANALLAHNKNGDDDAVIDGEDFAKLLTRQMREVRPDKHLILEFSEDVLPEHVTGTTPEELARYREVLRQQNCTFEKAEFLPHNIGYLKLNSFPDVSFCQATAAAAMESLNQADAIIFDLRDNRGGQPEMVMFLAAYLFDHPEYMYNPRENTTERCWTRSPVSGSRLADKPVYLLTSHSTISAAEHFTFDLKMLKRATIVGETTGGAAHSGVWHRIDDHFGMGVPETKAINPFSKEDWAEVGVEPDVKTTAKDALETAEKLAQNRIHKN